MTATKKYGGLLCWILITALAGFIGSQFMPGAWYQAIAKPHFTPPNWIFPVVWPVLYLCMAVAVWLVWKESDFERDRVDNACTLIEKVAYHPAHTLVFPETSRRGYPLWLNVSPRAGLWEYPPIKTPQLSMGTS